MSDSGLSVQFGVSVTPDAHDLEQVMTLVDTADQTGLDLVGVQDHAYNPQFLDTWTLLAFLAARTERVRFFPDVADLALRPPAMLAKAAASLDRLSGGRIELGLGFGAFQDQIAAMGGPRRTPGEAVASTEEAIQIARLAWSTAPSVSFAGHHYQLQGYQPGPPPAHPIGIWLGAVRPQMLRLTGRRADGWVSPLNSYVGPEQVPAAQAIIDQAAQGAGRAPYEIRRIYNVLGAIDAGPRGGRGLIGSGQTWAESLTRWTISRRDRVATDQQSLVEAARQLPVLLPLRPPPSHRRGLGAVPRPSPGRTGARAGRRSA